MEILVNRRIQIANEIAILVGQQLESLRDSKITGLELTRDVIYSERRKRIAALREELRRPVSQRFPFL